MLEKTPNYDFADWKKQIDSWKTKYSLGNIYGTKSKVTPFSIIQEINRVFEDAVITTDVGQNQLWTTQFLELTEKKQMLTSGGLGTMGYGLPAAIGAKIEMCIRDRGSSRTQKTKRIVTLRKEKPMKKYQSMICLAAAVCLSLIHISPAVGS